MLPSLLLGGGDHGGVEVIAAQWFRCIVRCKYGRPPTSITDEPEPPSITIHIIRHHRGGLGCENWSRIDGRGQKVRLQRREVALI